MEGLEKSLDLDKERQLAALREKLEAKRGQRLDEQKRKQELYLQKELLEQKKELEQVQNKQVWLFHNNYITIYSYNDIYRQPQAVSFTACI